jgi:hypothetical protein
MYRVSVDVTVFTYKRCLQVRSMVCFYTVCTDHDFDIMLRTCFCCLSENKLVVHERYLLPSLHYLIDFISCFHSRNIIPNMPLMSTTNGSRRSPEKEPDLDDDHHRVPIFSGMQTGIAYGFDKVCSYSSSHFHSHVLCE